MQKIFAVCAAALLLAGCSQKAPLEYQADGECTGTQADLVKNHISGQIDALAEKEWELAHSFASDSFQANVSIDDFSLIIGTQYAMLVENKGYEFESCTFTGNTSMGSTVTDGTINQEVKVLSGDQEFSLTYTLSVKGSTLGVESAVVSKSATRISA
jgi:hypothetical protein